MTWLRNLLPKPPALPLRAAIPFLVESQSIGLATVARSVVHINPETRTDPFALTELAKRVLMARFDPKTEADVEIARLVDRYIDENHPSWAELPPDAVGVENAFLVDVPIPEHRLPADMTSDCLYFQVPSCRFLPPGRGGRARVELLEVTWDDLNAAHDERVATLQDRGQQINAAVVQAHHELYRPGVGDRFALVLFSFDPEVNDNEDRLISLADRAARLKGTEPDDPIEAAVANLVTHERAIYHHRERLPQAFTDGPVVFAATLLIHRPYLPDGFLHSELGRVLPCVAAQEPFGGQDLLPILIAEE